MKRDTFQLCECNITIPWIIMLHRIFMKLVAIEVKMTITTLHIILEQSVLNNCFLVFYTVCDNRHFSGPNGTISSPNYPTAYANNLDCYSYISVSSGNKVLITFLAFNTQSGNDWVTVRIKFLIHRSSRC